MTKDEKLELIECLAKHSYEAHKRIFKKRLSEIESKWEIIKFEGGFIFVREIKDKIFEIAGYCGEKIWLRKALKKAEEICKQKSALEIVTQSYGDMDHFLKRLGFEPVYNFYRKEVRYV